MKKKTVYVFGSYHKLSIDNVSEKLFSDVLRNIEPEFIFIEWPVTWFDENGQIKKNYAVPTFKRKEIFVDQLLQGMYDQSDYKGYDSSILVKFAREKGIRLIPFDIADRNKITHYELGSRKAVSDFFDRLPEIKNSVAQMGWQWRESLLRIMGKCQKEGLPRVNSLACDATVKEYYEHQKVLLENLKGYNVNVSGLKMSVDWWSRRRKAMAENICQSISQLDFKKALIHTGWHHRYHLLEDIKKCKGFNIVYLWEDLLK